MEKTDSLAPKSEYPASEVSFGSEPPPAYKKPRSITLQIARIAAVTIVISSFVLGSFILAASWIQAVKSCHQHSDHLHPAAQKTNADSPMFQKLVDVAPIKQQEVTTDVPSSSSSSPSTTQTSKEDKTEEISATTRMPLTLDFDEIAGALLNQNLKSKMNCVVEKKKTDDNENKTLISIHGEQLVIFCHSDKDERSPNEESMISPMMMPFPGPLHLPFHLPFQPPVFTPHHVPIQQHQVNGEHVSFQPVHVHQEPQHPPQPERLNFHHIPLNPAQQEPQQRHPPHYVRSHSPADQRSRQIETIREALPFIHQQMIQALSETREPPFRALLRKIAGLRAIPVQVIEQKNVEHLLRPNSEKMPVQVAEVEVTREGRSFRHPIQIPTIQVVDPREARMIHLAEARESRMMPTMEIQDMSEAREGKMFPPGMPIAEITQETVIPVAEAREYPAIPHTRVRPPAPPENQDRPHFVQPRSIRSVDDILRRDKRTRRCACDCAC